MKNIVIIGAGDFGKEVAWLIEYLNKYKPIYNLLGFLDDDIKKIGQDINGYQCLGSVNKLYKIAKEQSVCAVIAMQDGNVRKRIVEKLADFDNWETVIHPTANISDTTTVGKGCIICAGNSISVNTVIGDHCVFNIGGILGHDCIIGNYVSVMAGACICGHVTINDYAYLATNCTVVPRMKIGSHAVVGAGSVVLRNVKDSTTVMGVPAKRQNYI